MTAATDLVSRFVDFVVDPAILIVFAFGFFLFIWGLVQFLWRLDEGGENTTGKQHILWGIVGMLVMVSVYGIISIIDNTFQLNSANPDVSRLNNVNAPANFFGQ